MDFIGIAIILVGIFLLYNLFKWHPRKGKWYRNKRWSRLMGHEVHEKNCYVIKNGKKRRGSFKVIKNGVKYLVGWRYHKDKVKKVSKYWCSFAKHSKHIPLRGQGTAECFIKTYTLRIR